MTGFRSVRDKLPHCPSLSVSKASAGEAVRNKAMGRALNDIADLRCMIHSAQRALRAVPPLPYRLRNCVSPATWGVYSVMCPLLRASPGDSLNTSLVGGQLGCGPGIDDAAIV